MPVNLLGTAGVRIRVAAKQIKTILIDVEHPQVAARTSYTFLSSSFSSKLATYPFINDVCDAWSILLRPFFFLSLYLLQLCIWPKDENMVFQGRFFQTRHVFAWCSLMVS